MKTLFTILLIFCVTSCNAQTPKIKKMTPKLSDKEIKEQGYQIKKEDTIFMKDGKLDIERLEKIGTPSGSKIPLNYYYEEYLDDSTHLYVSGDKEDGYSKKLRQKNGLFETFHGYYNSGNLKITGRTYINRFSSGIRYYFDEQGSIEKYENYDAPYKFSWEDVQIFLKEQNIKQEQITNIYRGALEGVHGWEIIYKPKEFLNTDNVKVLTLDAKTGKILSAEIKDVSRQLD